MAGVYSLGKAQRVIALLRAAGYGAPLYIHGALAELCALYEDFGIDLGPLLAPDAIDVAVTGDRENPGARCSLLRVILLRAAPDQQHHLLNKILGGFIVRAQTAGVGFDPGCEMGKELRKCDLIAAQSDGRDQISHGSVHHWRLAP